MIDDRSGDALSELAVLAEPMRRRLYRHVSQRPEPVSRDEAAAALGISRSLAAFHLDRLVAAGLLATEYRRLSGRTGPGAGRPSKLYRVSERETIASVPPRRYEVAARLFADALSAEPGSDAVADRAHEYGAELGAEAAERAGHGADAGRRREALVSVLRDAGYVPFEREGEIRLRNCPFHELAQRHRQLTCGMNLALLRGMLAGANLPSEAARLDFQPGLCCVAIGSSS